MKFFCQLNTWVSLANAVFLRSGLDHENSVQLMQMKYKKRAVKVGVEDIKATCFLVEKLNLKPYTFFLMEDEQVQTDFMQL